MSQIETYNSGVSLISGTTYSSLPNGWYRLIAVTSDVTVTTSINASDYYTIGTVSVGTSKDVYFSENTYLKCTFADDCILQRMQGMN